ncbi:DnaJ-like protein DjlA [hydrothermal vent metagenome]|uniref:DnaJ-like protein DjlA n=1 Tax=hydrothermal vent metagenome TaxID=652676 RepID=A0A1W1EF40_9ZZZZ
MINIRKWIYLAVTLLFLYYVFIVNIWVTLTIVASLYVAFNVYKIYARNKLNKLSGSKELFRQSELGHFVALAAKVAKADGRVSELEAHLVGIMFDDISNVFIEKEKTRAILKEIFSEEKNINNTKEVAESLNNLLGRSILKRRQFIGFLIQLAFVDSGISSDEDNTLRIIATELNISPNEYAAMVSRFENMTQNKQESMGLEEAYEILGVNENDDMVHIKKVHRQLVRKYHPDILMSQKKDEAYIEEATSKMQDINKAYNIIKSHNKE